MAIKPEDWDAKRKHTEAQPEAVDRFHPVPAQAQEALYALRRNMDLNRVGLLSVKRKSDGADVVLIIVAAMNEDGDYDIVPLAEMLPPDAVDLYDAGPGLTDTVPTKI